MAGTPISERSDLSILEVDHAAALQKIRFRIDHRDLGAGATLLALVMAGIWAVARRIRNAGIVDIAWSANFGLLAVLCATTLPGHLPRQLLIAGMTLVWSLRLALYLYRRVMGHHPVEDGRYERPRREWAPHADRR